MFEKLSRLALGFLVSVWVARYLGPRDYGALMTTLGVLSIAGTAISFGLEVPVTRRIVEDRQSSGRVLSAAIALRLCVATGVVPLAYVAMAVTSEADQTTNGLFLFCAGSTLLYSISPFEQYFNAVDQNRIPAIKHLLGLVVGAAIRGCLIFVSAPLIAFGIALLVESLVAIGGLTYAACRRLRLESNLIRRLDDAMALAREAWPIAIVGISAVVYMRVDQMLLNRWSGSQAAGIYAAVTRLSEAWQLIPLAFITATFPRIIASMPSAIAYATMMRSLFCRLMALNIAVCVVVTVFSEEIIALTYGQRYASASNVLAIHIWSSIFLSIGVASARWYVLEGLQRILIVRVGLGLFANLLLNAYLIPRFGVVGAAWSAVITQAVVSLLGDMFSRRSWRLLAMKFQAMSDMIRLKVF